MLIMLLILIIINVQEHLLNYTARTSVENIEAGKILTGKA